MMILAVEPGVEWEIDGARLSRGVVVIERIGAVPPQPAEMRRSSLSSRHGWTVQTGVCRHGETIRVSAWLELDGEVAGLVATCASIEWRDHEPAWLALLASARPAWTDAIVLSELLALPELDLT